MAKKLTRTQANKIIKMLGNAEADFEADGMEFNDEMAFELAQNVLYDNPGFKEFIIKDIGASDYVGWLANQV